MQAEAWLRGDDTPLATVAARGLVAGVQKCKGLLGLAVSPEAEQFGIGVRLRDLTLRANSALWAQRDRNFFQHDRRAGRVCLALRGSRLAVCRGRLAPRVQAPAAATVRPNVVLSATSSSTAIPTTCSRLLDAAGLGAFTKVIVLIGSRRAVGPGGPPNRARCGRGAPRSRAHGRGSAYLTKFRKFSGRNQRPSTTSRPAGPACFSLPARRSTLSSARCAMPPSWSIDAKEIELVQMHVRVRGKMATYDDAL